MKIREAISSFMRTKTNFLFFKDFGNLIKNLKIVSFINSLINTRIYYKIEKK